MTTFKPFVFDDPSLSPYIKRELQALEELSSSSIIKTIKHQRLCFRLKKEQESAIQEHIKKLFLSLSIYHTDSLSLQGRVLYIGSQLSKVDSIPFPSLEHKLVGLLEPIGILKNALHVEAFLFSPFYHLLYSRKTLTDCFKNIFAKRLTNYQLLEQKLENLKSKIVYVEETQHYHIDISEIIHKIEDTGIVNLSLEFDRIFFIILSMYPMENNLLVVRDQGYPSGQFTEKLLESSDPLVQHLGELLFALTIKKIEFEVLQISPDRITKTMQMLSTASYPPPVDGKTPKQSSDLIFSEYLPLKQLIPHLCSLLAKREALSQQGLELSHLLTDTKQLNDFLEPIPKNWIDQTAITYELIVKIETIIRKFIDPALCKEFDKQIEPDLIDERLRLYIKEVEKIYERKSIVFASPIDKTHTFCVNAEQLKRLQCISGEPLLCKKTKERSSSHPMRLHHYIQDQFSALVVKCYSPESQTGYLLDRILDILNDRAEPSIKAQSLQPIALQVPAKKETALSVSIQESIQKHLLSHPPPKISQRVQAWLSSVEQGLASRKEELQCGISQHDMILRHRIPNVFLEFIFTPLYSNKSAWGKVGAHTHFESLLLIDQAKFILEATVDTNNELYHLYARPIKKWSDYFLLSQFSLSEFPTLSSKKAAPSLLCPETTYEIKDSGNIALLFEKKIYELVLIHPPCKEV